MANLVFKDAERARDAVVASQKKEIADLYEKWAKDIEKQAQRYGRSSNASAPVSKVQMRQLLSQVKAAGQQTANEVYNTIKRNMYTVADGTVKCNAKWMEGFGFSKDGVEAAFSYVPTDVVERLITGQVYESGWSLSKSIWGANEAAMKDIYEIVAKGRAENLSVQEVARQLSQFVSPTATKRWNPRLVTKNTATGKLEYKRIFSKQVDYNAQRLARTLAQHSYQQSFVAVTKNNPFVEDYVWHSNGSRACELCQDRDGRHFAKDDLPMDHPNGMCVMEPTIADNIADQIADWFNSEDGTYPEIDEFAKEFGYEAKSKTESIRFAGVPTNVEQFQSKWDVHVTGLDKHAEEERAGMLEELDKSMTWYVENVSAFSAGEAGTVRRVVFEKMSDCVGFVRSKTPWEVHCTNDYDVFSKEVTNHEFAHSLIGQAMEKQGVPAYDYKAREKFCKEVKREAFAQIDLKATKSNIKKYVSDYAVTDDEEFIAEALKGCYTKSRSKLEQSVFEVLIRKIGG